MKRSKLFLIISIAALFIGGLQATVSPADGPKIIPGAPTRYGLVSCATNPQQAVACIESITAIDLKDPAKTYPGNTTGRTVPLQSDIASNDGIPSHVTPETAAFTLGKQEEWQFPGLTFGVGGNTVMAAVQLQPDGATWCWFSGVCDNHREEFQISFYPTSPSTTAPTPLHFRDYPSDLQCGPKNSPTFCYGGPNLGGTYRFIIKMRVPQDFLYGEVSGRGVQNLLVKDEGNLPAFHSVPTKEMTVQLTNLKYSATLTSELIPDWRVKPSAHFETDLPVLWIFGQKNGFSDNLGPCSKSGGVILTSNAPNTTDPTWDPANESINVQISAPHLTSAGDPNIGYLEIRIPRVMAKCLWNTDLAEAVSAKINISYDDGGAPSVVAVAGKLDGQDYVVVTSGFHYSSPKLSIKLSSVPGHPATPEPVVTPAPAPTTAPVTPKAPAKPAALKTITCVKGSLSKKVTAAKPLCPAGYKQK